MSGLKIASGSRTPAFTIFQCRSYRCLVTTLTEYCGCQALFASIPLHTPWSRVLLEKLTASLLVKKFPAFWGMKVYSRIYKCPPPVPIPSHLDPVHTPISHFLKIHLNIILEPTPGSPQVVSFPQVSPPKPYIRLSSPPYALHAPPISFFSILSPEKYWVRSTDH